MGYRAGQVVMVVMLAMAVSACTSVQTQTVDKGKYEKNGQTYRHLTTTVTIERDPVCEASCRER